MVVTLPCLGKHNFAPPSAVVAAPLSQAMQAEREAETSRRLGALIELLSEENPHQLVLPPPGAAAWWSEAAVRRFFATGELPQDDVDDSQPGGGRPQHTIGLAEPPPALLKAQAALTANAYRHVAIAAGIPRRRHGLFPPNDALLSRLAADASLKPFQKHLVDEHGVLQLTQVSWPVGDDACQRGIDLRYFIDSSRSGVGTRLVAAVRYSKRAAIGADYFTSTHGGAIETAFDEATAELAKCSLAPTATTVEFSCSMKKPVPLNETMFLECVLDSVASGGLRINTSATMKTVQGVVLATARAQLVDIAALRKAQGT